MLTCFKCAKPIKTKKYIRHVPSNLAIALEIDFEKAYHAKCYEIAEKEAEKELLA